MAGVLIVAAGILLQNRDLIALAEEHIFLPYPHAFSHTMVILILVPEINVTTLKNATHCRNHMQLTTFLYRMTLFKIGTLISATH